MSVRTPPRHGDDETRQLTSARRRPLTGFSVPTGIRILSVIAGGMALYAASAPRELWWLAPLSFTLLAVATHDRRARAGFAYGVLFGVAYLLPLMKWLFDFLGADFGVFPWLGVVALESVFFGLAGAGMAWVSRSPAAPVWMASLLVASEAARSRVPFGGFPWGRVAFSQVDGPFLPLASLGGVPLVSFTVALTGCGLAALLPSIRASPRRWIVPLVMAALPAVVGWAVMPTIGTTPEAGTATVAVVQGNAPDVGIALLGEGSTVRANHIAQAERLVADVRAGRVPKPDLVILPESSNTFDASRIDPDLDRIAAELDAPLAAGGLAVEADGTISNRAIRWDPAQGPTEEYAKQQLVPFSEFIPLRALAGAVTPFVEQFPNDMVPGDRTAVFTMGPARVGFAICYEVAYDYVFNEATRAGAQLLVVPTNNAWFGRTEMTYQQLAMSRVRAVENGRAVVVASTSGVSAIVQPDGTITRRTGQFTAETLVAEVPLRSSTTPATRLGGAPEWTLTALGLLGMAMTWRRSRSRIVRP